jgi:hypothetical protein
MSQVEDPTLRGKPDFFTVYIGTTEVVPLLQGTCAVVSLSEECTQTGRNGISDLYLLLTFQRA